MSKREELDLKRAKEYSGRWIIGRGLIFPKGLGISPNSVSMTFEDPEMTMNVKIMFDDEKTKPEDLYELGILDVQPTPIYFDLESARIFKDRLEELRELHSSVLGEIDFYDNDEKETLLALYVLSREVPDEKMIGIKRQIEHIERPYHGKVLTYDYNIDGKWTSIEWKHGLHYRDRYPGAADDIDGKN